MKTNHIYEGDCIEVLKKLDKDSIDSIVTDPPYGIGFMGKEWDNFKQSYQRKDYINPTEATKKRGYSKTINSPATRAGEYDLSEKGKRDYQQWCNEWAKECLRVLKPGGYLMASNSTRMYHRMACAIEDAGFEIRDMIEWIYGSGFPKSLNIGKAVDKLQGNEREVVGTSTGKGYSSQQEKNLKEGFRPYKKGLPHEHADRTLTKGTSPWEGWGTALKPAHEPICMARKPLSEKSVVENVLKHKTGGINIDGSRVGTEKITQRLATVEGGKAIGGKATGIKQKATGETTQTTGRFPANLIHDGSKEVVKEFPKEAGGDKRKSKPTYSSGMFKSPNTESDALYNDSGSASRFFYCAKASKAERNRGCEGLEEKDGNIPAGIMGMKKETLPKQNHHPTVKPIKLMKYLIKMVTPKGGIVLDPFLGSGTTAMAAKELGFKYIGIEKEKEYCKIAKARVKATEKPLL